MAAVKGVKYGKLEFKHDPTVDILTIPWIVIFFWIVWWYCMKEIRMGFGLRPLELIFSLTPFFLPTLFSSVSVSLSLFSIHLTWNCLLRSHFPSLPCLLSYPFFAFPVLSSITSLPVVFSHSPFLSHFSISCSPRGISSSLFPTPLSL